MVSRLLAKFGRSFQRTQRQHLYLILADGWNDLSPHRHGARTDAEGFGKLSLAAEEIGYVTGFHAGSSRKQSLISAS